jgi:CTP:phosphocholine cytidylyltransferase-like protein
MKTKQSIKKKPKNLIKRSQSYDDLTTFIILCDLPGYRMKSYGPSCLLEIGKVKLIDHQISIIKSIFNHVEIILCLGFESEHTIKYLLHSKNKHNVKIIENQLFDRYYSCESLRLALNITNNSNIFVLDGSLLIHKDIFKSLSFEHNLLFSQPQNDDFEISFNINEDKVIEHISYGATIPWSEILFINAEYINELKRILSTGNFKNKFIFEAINELIKHNIEFKPHKTKYSIKKINNIKNYHDIRNKR